MAGIYEYTREGRHVRTLPLPRSFVNDDGRHGMRHNGGIEALCVSPDRKRLVAVVEASLLQDDDENALRAARQTSWSPRTSDAAVGRPSSPSVNRSRPEPCVRTASSVGEARKICVRAPFGNVAKSASSSHTRRSTRPGEIT